jgi:molecular chaperone GrpE
MDEEKRHENIQEVATQGTGVPETAEISEPVEQVGSEPMSAETNLSNGAEIAPDAVSAEQEGRAAEGRLEPEVEPFDLSPESPTSAEQQPQATAASLESEQIEELNQRVEALKTQLEERNNQYMRLAADFENYRKRTQKEKEEQEQQVKGSTIKELLSVVDNFERARSQIKPQSDADKTIHNSYQGIYKDFVDRLKKLGVAPMRTEGEQFDPSLHEAVMREETNQYPEGTVVEELRRGYVLGELVLRHAMVKVATAPESSASAEEASSN